MLPSVRVTPVTSITHRRRPYKVDGRLFASMLSLWLLCLFTRSIAAAPAMVTQSSPPASVSICVVCHGVEGAGSASGIPRLAGMDANYLSHTLIAFRSGKRSSDTMQPIAKTLSDEDIAALARYFSTQEPPLPPSLPVPPADSRTAGETLALRGDSQDGIPPCFSCHAANGLGSGERYPRIAGEPAIYVIKRLHDFQARARIAAPKAGSMTEVASKLTEPEIRNVAAYLSIVSTR